MTGWIGWLCTGFLVLIVLICFGWPRQPFDPMDERIIQ
jgi:hypothetical protein